MARTVGNLEAVASIVRRLGEATAADVLTEARLTGLVTDPERGRAWASNNLHRAADVGLIRRARRGVYTVDPLPPTTTTAAGGQLVGVPLLGDIPREFIEGAIAGILDAGRALSNALDHADGAAAEYITGVLRDQGRIGGMFRLMLEVDGQEDSNR